MGLAVGAIVAKTHFVVKGETLSALAQVVLDLSGRRRAEFLDRSDRFTTADRHTRSGAPQ